MDDKLALIRQRFVTSVKDVMYITNVTNSDTNDILQPNSKLLNKRI